MREDLRRVVNGQPVSTVPHHMDETSVLPVVEAAAVPRRAPQAQRRERAIWPWVVAILVLLAIGVGAAAAAGVFGPLFGPTQVTVPDVTGKRLAVAESEITSANLTVSRWDPQTSDTVASGTVISQTPAGGLKIDKGGSVALVVSSGPATVEVPAVVAMTEAAASATIQDVHLRVAIVRNYNAAKAGTVYAQSPKSGTIVAKDSTVTISVSQGIQQVTVPDVAGKSESDARAALKAAKFKVSTTRSYSTVVSSGVVISSDPAGGSSVDYGSTVTLNISKGPQMVTVPDLHGLDEPTAQSKLDALGLKITADTSKQAPTTADVGNVFDQTPSSGSKVLPGTTVTVFIGQAPPLVP